MVEDTRDKEDQSWMASGMSMWRQRQAKRAKRERERRGREPNVCTTSTSPGEAFIDGLLEGFLETGCCKDLGTSVGVKIAVALYKPHRQEPAYIPARSAPVTAALPAEKPEAAAPRHYDHQFQVRAHVMNLGGNRKASQAKQDTASENGFVLRGRQTWVKAHIKGGEKS